MVIQCSFKQLKFTISNKMVIVRFMGLAVAHEY